MSTKTYFVVQAPNEWRLISDQATLLFPVEDQALSTAIKAASIAAEDGDNSRVVRVDDDDHNLRVIWSSKLPIPEGAEHRKRA
jgi:hypothetical protein